MTAPVPPPVTAEVSDLAHRYGAPAPWRRRVLAAVVALLGVVFLCWVAWVALSHGTPAVESELVGFDVESDSSVVVRVAVQLEEGVSASCRVRAFAEDHTTVGEKSFTPQQGENELDVRTERRATSIENIGCTTADQERPR